MEDMILVLLEQSKQSLKIYEDMQEKLTGSVLMSLSDCMNYKTIADNCIQMAAVNWCKVFASKKSKSHYAAGAKFNKQLFLSLVEARGVSFQETCDKMRSFRDKYAEEKYTREEVKVIFEAAMGIVEEYEKASVAPVAPFQ
ncbi:MAG: hypothetical protein IKO41_15330 [Lachnospiraceae bacterium]|nr:hypothetical protein [Lachnospiraceae bacterium]